jgi:DNA invertase Pin-like site-specific DNA recombinase
MNNPPLDNPPISDRHRRRLAYVYIRQSTLRQVAEHQESQELQYQLASRAQALGWPAERIEVIDEDLGKSAVSSSGRTGFQRLFTDIGLGKAGILLVTDVSRLARNCADWYQLLDLAALRDVLVCDTGGVYNPRAYDDRLLLGVKGAFSEAQWYIMRQQLQAARLNKAKRGELALRLAVGYERLPNGQVVFSPDQQVQGAIRLVFDLFRRYGSARAVLRQLIADGLQLPRQARNAVGQATILWSEPAYSQVYFILKLPLYAGAYAYGKRQREHLPGQPGTVYGRRLPPQEWQVLRHDHFPAYISWEEYLANQETLADNWQTTRFAGPDATESNLGSHNAPFSYQGAAGKGRALLAGLVLCGVCGRRLRIRYADKPAYDCEATKAQFDQPRCHSPAVNICPTPTSTRPLSPPSSTPSSRPRWRPPCWSWRRWTANSRRWPANGGSSLTALVTRLNWLKPAMSRWTPNGAWWPPNWSAPGKRPCKPSSVSSRSGSVCRRNRRRLSRRKKSSWCVAWPTTCPLSGRRRRPPFLTASVCCACSLPM